MTLRLPLCLLGAATVMVLATPGLAAPNDLSAAKPAIDRANSDWLPAMQAKDSERLAAAYAQDGVLVLADGRQIAGRTAIAAFYRQRLAKLWRVLGGGIHHDGMTLASDGLIYEWGHGGAITIDAGGRRTTTDGPFLTVWKRQVDGGWAIVRNLSF